jgi:hypothetical protein
VKNISVNVTAFETISAFYPFEPYIGPLLVSFSLVSFLHHTHSVLRYDDVGMLFKSVEFTSMQHSGIYRGSGLDTANSQVLWS